MVVYLSVGYISGILVNVFMYYIKDLLGINGVLCLGIVYCIDKDMFGFFMIVKNDEVYLVFV